jgi:hypothetical protein
MEQKDHNHFQWSSGDSRGSPGRLGHVARRHLCIQDPGLAIRPPHRPDLQPGRADRLRHDPGDPELSPPCDRQDSHDIQGKTGWPAGSATRMVLSRQKLGRGIRLSEGESHRAGQSHQYTGALHAGRASPRSRRAHQVGGRSGGCGAETGAYHGHPAQRRRSTTGRGGNSAARAG